MNTLHEIKLTQVVTAWPEAEEYLSQAMTELWLERDLTNLKARVMAGLDTLWRIDDKDGETLAWGTTLLYTADGVQITAQIKIACSHSMKLFLAQMDEFESWAHERGAHFIEVVGRKGWERVLRPAGFEHNYTSLVKRIFKELH